MKTALPAQLWHRYPRETLALALLTAAGVALGGAAWSTPSVSGTATPADQAPPSPPPLLVRELARDDALSVNSNIPLTEGPNPSARPFALGRIDGAALARAEECLTSAVYYEAGSESLDGQRAVAQVILNRVRHPAFPATVCGVVYQGSTRVTGCQFTFTCDGSLARAPVSSLWRRSSEVARAALRGYVHAPVGWATHYHADYVVPYWASTLAKNAVIGAHIFYRWSGGWGRSPAFTQRYAQGEPNNVALRSAALAAEQAHPAVDAFATTQAIQDIPGAEVIKLTPAMRRDKVVAVRFNLAARQASEKAERAPYVDKNAVSDTLRWSLTGGKSETESKPLGRAEEKNVAALAAPDAGATQ